MRVWIVETGMYEDKGIGGVYSSPERAMAAHPIPADYKFPKKPSAMDLSAPLGWHEEIINGVNYGWTNGMDWDNAAQLIEFEVDGDVPVGDPK